MALSPSGFYLFRGTNSSLQGNSGSSNESYGANPYQHFVDFDLVGPTFRVIFNGALGSSGIGAPGFTWNIRIGGTYAVSGGTPDGDLVSLGTTGAISAFACGQASVLVTNIWSGTQLVKVTGSLPGGNAFAADPVLLFFPVES